jgi:transposase-like protein
LNLLCTLVNYYPMKTKVQNRSTKGDAILQALPKACSDEKAAVEFMELQRWGDSPACPSCGSVSVYQMKDSKTGDRQVNYRWRCKDCKDQYTVRKGTVFEDSRIGLRHWCFGFWRAATSKKGVSALEIHRQTGLSYKSCLFMLHRIRFAMAPADSNPLTGIVEVDETYVGGKPRHPREARAKWTSKVPVMAMVERGGRVRPTLIPNVTAKTLHNAIRENVDRRATIMTDELSSYSGIGKEFEGGHHTVNHSADEYVRGDVTTNTAEGFFSILKRGINGIYHSVSKKHLHRYLAEYEFRYNHRELDDGARTVAAIKAAEGKRLIYKATTK